MTSLQRRDPEIVYIPRPTIPNPMVGHRGAPPGAPPMPWHIWLLSMFGLVRRPRVWDNWRWEDGTRFPG